MAAWVKCTSEQGKSIFLNRDAAISVAWAEDRKLSVVGFAGVSADYVRIKQTAEQFLQAGIDYC